MVCLTDSELDCVMNADRRSIVGARDPCRAGSQTFS
jgi:hypothetical protein